MTLREFIKENQITAFEIVSGIILNIVVGEALYGLDVDTSQIEGGVKVERIEEFTIEEDYIIVNGIELSLETLILI
jgi:hypothetical protein